MGTNHLITKVALVANGVAMMLVYPLNMLVLERTSWIWDAPSRNPPLEHMLVAVYVTMGAFLVWAARDPVRFLPLIDFVIVSGAIHATTMAVDAWYTPGMMVHLAFRGDVIGTYIAPVTLALTHPRALLSFRKRSNDMNRDGLAARFCARLVIVALAGGIMLELMHAIEGARPGFQPADWICRGAPARTASAN